MNFKKLIFSSLFWGTIGNVISFAIAFLLTPFLIHSLGDEGYGIWLLILATLGWFRVIDFGFSSAVQRSIAIAMESNDDHRINTIFSCSIILFGLLGSIAGILLFMFSFYPQVLGIEDKYFDIVHISLMILSLKIVWDFLMCSFHGFYTGLIRYDIDANINTINELIKALLVVTMVTWYDIYGAVLATMLADVVTNIYKIYYAKKLHAKFRFQWSLVKLEEFKALFSYSKHIIALSIANSFSKGVDSLIISHILGLKYIAIYNIAFRLVDMVERALLPILGIFQPIFTRLLERKDDIQPEVEQVVSLDLFIVSIFFVPLAIFANDFIFLWLGKGFEQAHMIVIILAFTLLCRTISRPISQLLLAKAQHKYLSVIRMISVIINIPLSIILGQYYGLMGIAIATLISFYITDLFLHLILYKFYIKNSVTHLAISFFRTNIIMIAMILLGYKTLETIDQLDWIGLFIYSSGAFILSVMIFWISSLNEDAKTTIISMVKDKMMNKGILG